MTTLQSPWAVRVPSSSADYEVVVAPGAVQRLPDLLGERARAHRYAVISDRTVADLHARRVVERCVAAGLDARLYTFPAGEAFKTRGTWAELTDALLDDGHARDSVVVALGGGVTGDLGGFVAATFMRGIPVVQVPTTYLAMIDASVGGKTGVDVPHGKNLVGAFHPPAFVLADPEVLVTLPETERAQGLVEAFKHGAILDAGYFGRLETGAGRLLGADPEAATAAVRRSVELKADVVGRDEHEGGYRQILNFGHTLGHAVEAASAYAVGHGTAVGLGMLLEAELGERMGVTRPGTRRTLEEGLARLGLPGVPALDPDVVMGYLGADKKVRGGRPRYVLLREVGETDPGQGWSHEAPDELVREVLAERLG